MTAPRTVRQPGAAPACAHCGLPVPAGLVRAADAEQFCCNGCRQVRTLVHEWGFDQYYRLVGQQNGALEPARVTGRSFEDFDDERQTAEATEPSGPDRRRTRLYLEGVHCAACVWLLRELFLRRDGAIELVVNPSRGVAELTFVPARFDLAAYLAEAERFGYRFGPRRKEERPHSSGLLVRLGVSVAAAMNVNVSGVAKQLDALIRSGAPADDARLADPDVPLEELAAG